MSRYARISLSWRFYVADEELPERAKQSVASIEFLCHENSSEEMSRDSRKALMQTMALLCSVAEDCV